MTVVRSRIQTPHGAPAPGVAVAVRVVAFPAPWLDDSTGKVLGTLTTWTDQDGWWSLDLTPHTEFELGATVYAEVTEHSDNPVHAVTQWAHVPPPDRDDPARAVLLRDILIDPPPDPHQPPVPWLPAPSD